ncbi:unnamed protein product [Toxocara canis]|uniref:DUF8077 domain-containing protein n=1 Tax=Toxocara canis TaxID=6265 RepID=A0A183USW9_TOXCA|nr:unnamed protein product [Toxocara canis]
MLLNDQHVILVLISIAYAQVTATPEYGDPTPQEIWLLPLQRNFLQIRLRNFSELALLDWSSGVRVAYCADAAIEKLAEPFKSALVASLNKFCRNATACSLTKPVIFTSEHVVLLDGYPRRDYGSLQFRFVVVLPHGAVPRAKLRQPLLSKPILSNFLRKHISDIAQRLGWKVLSYERFPKFDAVTEFMNTALIPIGFFLLVFMVVLAYWSSTFRFVALIKYPLSISRRTMEIIEEQKECERDAELDERRKKNEGIDGPMSASMISTAKDPSSVKRSNEVLLDVSGLSSESLSISRSQESGLPVIPEIVIVPSEVQSPPSVSRERPSLASSRRYSRRLSSFEEIMKEKRHRRIRANIFGNRAMKRTWKSGSMALGGFGKS